MPLPTNHPPAVDTLKTLIADSDYHLTEIAERSGVPYQTLWKWYKGKQKSIGFLQAEQVYHSITGRTFLSC